MELSRDQAPNPAGRSAGKGTLGSKGECWEVISSAGTCVLVAALCLSLSLVSQKSPHNMLKIASVANNSAVMTRHRVVD